MNQIGMTPNYTGPSQTHQTTNPTNSQPAGPAGSVVSGTGITPISFGAVVAVPVFPVALMPAYMMAQPQYGGAIAGSSFANQGYSTAGSQDAAAGQGSHVTSNPTNSMTTQAPQAGFGGSSAYGSFGSMSVGIPMMMSPVLMAIGFPIMSFYGGQPSSPPLGADGANPGTPAPADDLVAPPVDAEVIDTTAPPPVEAPAAPAVIDVVPETNTDDNLPSLPIAEVNAADFQKYRLMEAERKSESSLLLNLTTNDGDVISLDFNQLDIRNSSKFNGKTLDGDRVKDYSFLEDSQRVVNMEVTGSLSAEEQAAIDSVLSSVVEAVQKFFSGDMDSAINKLQMMDFDTGQLSELSLNMSMTKTAQVTRAYHDGSDHLHDQMSRDADIAQALDFLASEQRRLIDVAGSVLEAPSAAKLVKTLMPPMLSQPFSDLAAELAANGESSDAPLIENESATDVPAVESAVQDADPQPESDEPLIS